MIDSDQNILTDNLRENLQSLLSIFSPIAYFIMGIILKSLKSFYDQRGTSIPNPNTMTSGKNQPETETNEEAPFGILQKKFQA